MHRTLAALSLAVLSACAGTTGTSGPPEAARPSMSAPQSGTFHIVRGTDTIAREPFTRTAARLDADMRVVAAGARIAYSMDLAPDASVTRLEMRAYAPGADTSAAQRIVATVRADSVTAEVTQRGGTPRTDRVASRPGLVTYVNPSPSAMEQIVRRARAMGGDSAQVPILGADNGQLGEVAVRFVGADSAILSLGPVVLRMRVDRAGSLLGGTVPSQGLVITRTN